MHDLLNQHLICKPSAPLLNTAPEICFGGRDDMNHIIHSSKIFL